MDRLSKQPRIESPSSVGRVCVEQQDNQEAPVDRRQSRSKKDRAAVELLSSSAAALESAPALTKRSLPVHVQQPRLVIQPSEDDMDVKEQDERKTCDYTPADVSRREVLLTQSAIIYMRSQVNFYLKSNSAMIKIKFWIKFYFIYYY